MVSSGENATIESKNFQRACRSLDSDSYFKLVFLIEIKHAVVSEVRLTDYRQNRLW